LGFVVSGALISRYGYRACFLFNALAYVVFILSLFVVRLRAHGESDQEAAEGTRLSIRRFFGILKSNPKISAVYLMAVALWLTGGSINVLEIPFAKKVMNATDEMITLLFFASASGSIAFSLVKSDLRSRIYTLPALTFAAGIAISLYVGVADFYFSLFVLFIFGLTIAAHNVVSMASLQNHLDDAELAQAVIVLNTLNQTVGLLAAALGVYLSTGYQERIICFAFAMLTAIASAAAYVRPGYRRALP
jgi:Na+/melibiose symporter-like transporter